MWQIGIICLAIAGAYADPGYAASSAGAGSYSSGGGKGGLYTSNYVSDGVYGPSFPYLGGFTYGYVPPVVPPFGFGFNNDLQNFIQSQFNLLQSQFNSIASLYNQQFAQQAAFVNDLHKYGTPAPGEVYVYTNYPTETHNRVSSSYAPTYSGAAYGAAASGAVGPGGVYQSVSTYPGGTLSNRFGGTTVTSGGGPGYVGISTFSSSDSSGNRHASTTVNDNGKVTHYSTG